MKTKKSPIEYNYLVHHIDKEGYKAIVPAINAVVFGDTLTELEEGIRLAIDEERKERGKDNMPTPDSHHTYSGKFVVRTTPAIHEQLTLEAKARGKSLNSYIQDKIQTYHPLT